MLYNMGALNSFRITEMTPVVFPNPYMLMDFVLNKTMEIPHKTISVFHYAFLVHTNSNILYLHLWMSKEGLTGEGTTGCPVSPFIFVSSYSCR